MILEFLCLDGGTHPVIGKVWDRFPRCLAEDGDRYDRYLCSALSMTMHSSDDCMKALALLELVESRRSSQMRFGINDTEVKFTDRGAQVDILIEEECGTVDGLFSLAEFRKAIVAWGEFLSKPCTHEYLLKVDIS
ncbi:hypothetical protein HH212_26995 (plasmid) [Massilia forsythiae]|uniref:Uncharacterized protein n=1 Tax=Massilia forsythiae TaxID=2728020 RepID=A0A7Z2ZVW5_9BURK|nr:hypothetical protein [Massilia forsythiae]QJE03745.1 hypothetical protein HH212_26995 [Massilia forsythiae]